MTHTHNTHQIKHLAVLTTAAILLAASPAQALPGGQLGESINGIVAQLQGYLEQIQAMPQIALEQAQTYLGELLEGNPELTAVLGELGIVDPDQVRQMLLEADIGDERMPAGLANIGVEAAIAGRTIAQGTLSQEGQARIKQELEGVIETVGDSQALADAAVERIEADQAAADHAMETGDQAAAYSEESYALAAEATQLADQAQSATSTQDVLKLLAQQTAYNGQVMAQLSSQAGGSSTQLGQLSTQLSSHSNQNANSAALQAKSVELSAGMATSLEENNVLLSGATLNLTEINDQMRGERIAKAIQDQAEAGRLGQVNRTNYRLSH